jgi:hypothetical protein
MASVPMTRRAYAVARAVAEGTVRKAIKAGKIKPTPDGLIDPDQADQGWLRWSARVLGRETYRDDGNGGAHPAALRAPMLEIGRDPDVERWLGELPEPIDSRVLDRLDQILAAVTALRRDLADRPSPHGLDATELRQSLAALNIKLGVAFHQLERAVRGEPLTIKPEVFGKAG